MRYLPVFMDVAGRRCLVVGGGEVALRKIELLRSKSLARKLHLLSMSARPVRPGNGGFGNG